MSPDEGPAKPGVTMSAPNAVQVPMHGHCEMCNKPIKADERFCGSPECDKKHADFVAEKKKSMWKFVAIIAGLMLFFTAIRQGWI